MQHQIEKLELKKFSGKKSIVGNPRPAITKYIIKCTECGLYKSFDKKKEATDYLKETGKDCSTKG